MYTDKMPSHPTWAREQMLLRAADGDHIFEPSTFVMFVDETGHEEFADKNHPVFGLGGCGILVGAYSRTIQAPWEQLKATSFGDSGKSLHASGTQFTGDQIAAISEFFRDHHFFRFAAVVHSSARLAAELPPYAQIAHTVMDQLRQAVSTLHVSRIVICVEESTRGDRLARRYLSPFETLFLRDEWHEWEVPVLRYTGSKALGDAGLEVADFIMHSAGTQVRETARGTTDYANPRKDFQVVFKSQQDENCWFTELKQVTVSSQDDVNPDSDTTGSRLVRQWSGSTVWPFVLDVSVPALEVSGADQHISVQVQTSIEAESRFVPFMRFTLTEVSSPVLMQDFGSTLQDIGPAAAAAARGFIRNMARVYGGHVPIPVVGGSASIGFRGRRFALRNLTVMPIDFEDGQIRVNQPMPIPSMRPWALTVRTWEWTEPF